MSELFQETLTVAVPFPADQQLQVSEVDHVPLILLRRDNGVVVFLDNCPDWPCPF